MSATALELAHRSCADRGLGRRWQCGRLRVALDPRSPLGGSLNLAVARYRLGSARARHRPILLALPGGPGQSALALAQQFRSNLPPRALRSADLVVMDPRGTGASGALDCPTIQRVGSASALSLADCARSLGPRARLYSTSATVADIEALRRALAAPRISIYAISYGTYVAQRYALAHPHQVDRLLLDSAIPLSTDPTDPTILSSNARALQALCGGGHCQTVTTDVVSDFGRVATRLRHGPPFGPTITPGSGHPSATQVAGPGSLESLLLAGDYDPTLRAATPAALHAGARGDASLLAKLQATAQADELVPGVHSLSVAAYYAASCQDPSLPWSATDPLAARQLHARALADGVAAGLPFDSSVVLSFTNLLTCAGWPWAHRRPARSARRGRGQAIPTLVVSGSQDTISPACGGGAPGALPSRGAPAHRALQRTRRPR